MRHGRPDIPDAQRLSARDMRGWITAYDLADTGSSTPPAISRQLATQADIVISSDLPRAMSSLRALGCTPAHTDALYREAELPVCHLGAVKLSPLTWAGLFRVLWLCGMSGDVESLRAAKARAAQAAQNLINLASASDENVLLMGHGIMNRLIASALLSKGWREILKPGKSYWSAGIYRSPT
ncbi:hypothetical protein BN137_3658 [Cronobacter condimenti 1330]|uniref:Phosphoglycerate mutase n=2 Tax=Cronobacter condimenti TaxID=1163710 RepID=K8A3U7_9ENTR|nr:phosphoglycerate mutase [Cronobacter condimenti 1330]CCJ74260.1 hypothetical protein BN137_3658 [Cronobacter condimenti 1330]